MAAVVAGIAPEVEAFFTQIFGTGVVGSIAKGALGGLAALSVADLIKYIEGNPKAKAVTPRFALVDLHHNQTLTFVSRKRAYRFLIKPRSRVRATKHTEIIREVPIVERVR